MKKCKNCNKEINNKYNIFCSSGCSATFNNKQKKIIKFCLHCGKELLNKNSTYCSHECHHSYSLDVKIKNNTASLKSIKTYLKKNYNFCSICKRHPEWNGSILNLILDHIDGDPYNNNLSNLRLVCPNCDSQLPTFKSRNRGNGRFLRRKRYKNNQSY